MTHLAVIAEPPANEVAVASGGEILLDGLPPLHRVAAIAPAGRSPSPAANTFH